MTKHLLNARQPYKSNVSLNKDPRHIPTDLDQTTDIFQLNIRYLVHLYHKSDTSQLKYCPTHTNQTYTHKKWNVLLILAKNVMYSY